MKALALILFLPLFTGCMLLPQPPAQASRRIPPVVSELDDLEALLQSEQQAAYRGHASTSGVENLRLGMNKRNVQQRLGSPSVVEVAGNPKYGYERWTYESSVPTMQGYMKERRVIYFERGQVVGWEAK